MIPNFIWKITLEIIDTYTGKVPLSVFLKNYFKAHPNAGSRDRKMIADLVFSWYRCSKAITITQQHNPEVDFRTKMTACVHLIKDNPLNKIVSIADIAGKYVVEPGAFFPFNVTISSGMDYAEWLGSMLVQPDLFIRLRKGRTQILHLLDQDNIPYRVINDTCIALPNSAKADQLLPADSYVVQDASSQGTAAFMHPKQDENWYDCCCGAGGKSLLLKDMELNINLTVSDKRHTIVENLSKRFKQYGLRQPVKYVLDVADSNQVNKTFGGRQLFDHIICDVPCSGSGTWARTPEQLFFFDQQEFAKYPPLQEKIATNASTSLKKGGSLIYITCSVFRQENEEIVEKVVGNTGLQLVEFQLICGVRNKADSMFIAVLRKL